MIKSSEQIRVRYDWNEFERRQEASSDQVQSLTTVQILEALKVPFDRSELKAELKRRKERLRYAKIMANPRTRAIYRERKRTERLFRKWSA